MKGAATEAQYPFPFSPPGQQPYRPGSAKVDSRPISVRFARLTIGSNSMSMEWQGGDLAL
jgi:hypothetical protein